VERSAVKQELTELIRYHEETKLLLMNKPRDQQKKGREAVFDNPAFVEENETGWKSKAEVVTGKTTKAVASNLTPLLYLSLISDYTAWNGKLISE
jgi:hypothetical protein